MSALTIARLLLSLVALLPLSGLARPPFPVDCGISSTGIDFGAYYPLEPAPTDFDGVIDVTCELTPSPSASNFDYNILLSTGSSGQYAVRTLRNGSGALNYNIYTDIARTRIWGNGTGGSIAVAGRMQLQKNVGRIVRTNTHVARGRIPARQSVDRGQYGDVLVVTLEF